MNVIGSRPDGWWRDRAGAVRSLAATLDRYAEATRDEVIAVFDGRPQPLDVERVEVRFAPARGPGAADDAIVELVRGDRAPQTLEVVTSDGELARRARALGARVVGAGAFRDEIDRAASRRP